LGSILAGGWSSDLKFQAPDIVVHAVTSATVARTDPPELTERITALHRMQADLEFSVIGLEQISRKVKGP
jgi:hypothetical protein